MTSFIFLVAGQIAKIDFPNALESAFETAFAMILDILSLKFNSVLEHIIEKLIPFGIQVEIIIVCF